MTLQELDTVTLMRAHPEHGLSVGDVGAVVCYLPGYTSAEVEFLAWDGSTVAIATIPVEDLRRLESQDVMHARSRPALPAP